MSRGWYWVGFQALKHKCRVPDGIVPGDPRRVNGRLWQPLYRGMMPSQSGLVPHSERERARVARIAVPNRLRRLIGACAKHAAVEARPIGVSALTKRLNHGLLHARHLALARIEAACVFLCGARRRKATGRRIKNSRVARGGRTGA